MTVLIITAQGEEEGSVHMWRCDITFAHCRHRPGCISSNETQGPVRD